VKKKVQSQVDCHRLQRHLYRNLRVRFQVSRGRPPLASCHPCYTQHTCLLHWVATSTTTHRTVYGTSISCTCLIVAFISERWSSLLYCAKTRIATKLALMKKRIDSLPRPHNARTVEFSAQHPAAHNRNNMTKPPRSPMVVAISINTSFAECAVLTKSTPLQEQCKPNVNQSQKMRNAGRGK